MSKKKSTRKTSSMAQGGLSSFLRKPTGQVTVIAVLALVIYLIASSVRGGSSAGLASTVSADEAYQMYQKGTFVLDVRTQLEWDDYHVPNTTLIPLDELPNRLSELPKDKEIVVICHSGNRSQQGRDILLNAGFNATSMTGGILAWYDKGYPVDATGVVQ
ncbi:MAG TPA: rhodanese-like domain-containing protein [Anaerolineales bacterium]|nr:rhodanese-like domain-containing protein [Anaerolineales bacterium]